MFSGIPNEANRYKVEMFSFLAFQIPMDIIPLDNPSAYSLTDTAMGPPNGHIIVSTNTYLYARSLEPSIRYDIPELKRSINFCLWTPLIGVSSEDEWERDSNYRGAVCDFLSMHR